MENSVDNNTDEELTMHSKSENMEFMIYENADEVFELLLIRYQIELEASMRGSDFTFDSVYLLYYKCHKINPNRGGSYINSPDWIKPIKQQ